MRQETYLYNFTRAKHCKNYFGFEQDVYKTLAEIIYDNTSEQRLRRVHSSVFLLTVCATLLFLRQSFTFQTIAQLCEIPKSTLHENILIHIDILYAQAA